MKATNQPDFHRSAREGNLEVLIGYIEESKASLESRDQDSLTALHLACKKGQNKIVQFLLSKGADIRASERMLLGLAFWYHHPETAQILLDNGANIEAQDGCQQTLLHLASKTGRLELLQLLLDKGANCNAKECNKLTPLHFASREGFFEITKLLLDKGADVNEKPDSKETPLHFAARSGHQEIVQLLLD